LLARSAESAATVLVIASSSLARRVARIRRNGAAHAFDAAPERRAHISGHAKKKLCAGRILSFARRIEARQRMRIARIAFGDSRDAFDSDA
jgi:hypothetical protein